MLKKTNIEKLFSLTICFSVLGFSNYASSQEVQSEPAEEVVEFVETQTISEEVQSEISQNSDIIPENQDTLPPQEEESIEQIVETETDTNIESEPLIPETLPESTKEENQKPKINYVWADFVAQKDCREFIRQLNTDNDLKELAQNLKPYCNTPKMSAWEKWLHTLRQEKKQLLISQTMGEISALKYIKVIPYFFFDIQNTNPKGNNPKDILDKIQQAIVEHQPQKAMDLVSKLPENWQKGLKNTTDMGQTIIKIKQELNNEQEVQND